MDETSHSALQILSPLERNPKEMQGVENPACIDCLAVDASKGEVLLIIQEHRLWDDSELQLFQLQEKLNAYFSFVLDGEMTEHYPQLQGLPVRIRLECVNPPTTRGLPLLQAVYDQANLQGIAFEVEAMGRRGGSSPGSGCECGNPSGCCEE
jgi:hypothetical protein